MSIESILGKRRNLLLPDDPFRIVQPRLAVAVGVNRALVLQQVHFWVEYNRKADPPRNESLGHVWVYNTHEGWQHDHFPFWSVVTVRRIFNSLEEHGLLVSMQPLGGVRTKWYRLDYEAVEKQLLRSSDQVDHMSGKPPKVWRVD